MPMPVNSILNEPGKIGSLVIKNRIVMPPMVTEYADNDGYITVKHIDYYGKRAKGGCGLIIVEASCIQFPQGQGFKNQIRLDDDKFLPGLTELSGAIRRYGAKTSIQLFHAGCGSPGFISGEQPAGPSQLKLPAMEKCRSLSEKELDVIEKCFVDAALRCQKAGFDSISIHACHGYLLANFLSPVCNRRNDKYGGNSENRAGYPVRILRAIKSAVDIPVLVRINALEYGAKELFGVSEEYSLDDAVKYAGIFEQNGADAIHTTCWGYGEYIKKGLFASKAGETVSLVSAIKNKVNIPVIGHGRVDLGMAESVISRGDSDFWGFGRSQIADPDFAAKVREGRLADIVQCRLCNKCEPISQFGKDTLGLKCPVHDGE